MRASIKDCVGFVLKNLSPGGTKASKQEVGVGSARACSVLVKVIL